MVAVLLVYSVLLPVLSARLLFLSFQQQGVNLDAKELGIGLIGVLSDYFHLLVGHGPIYSLG